LRLISFDDAGAVQGGVLLGEEVVPLTSLEAPAVTIRGLLAALDADGLATLVERAGEAQRRRPLASVRLMAPPPDPEKIICLGLNYRDHAAEIEAHGRFLRDGDTVEIELAGIGTLSNPVRAV
jgi:2-keto-4-pentenoate hydratase/2-oxohepta-3-ene-1,7-dioic acid hydratase in catechol pathway